MADLIPPKKKTAVTDPLEGSKVLSKPVVPPPPPAPAPVPVVVVPDPVVVGPVVKYRVVRTTTVSIHGQITRLNADDIISEESYGQAVMAQFFNSGVPLVKV